MKSAKIKSIKVKSGLGKGRYRLDLNVKRELNNIIINSQKGKMKIEVISNNIIHVLYTKRKSFSKSKSMMIKEIEKVDIPFELKEQEDYITVRTGELELIINKKTYAFIWQDKNGNILLKEPDRGGKYLEEIPVEIAVFDETSKVKTVSTADGLKGWRLPSGKEVDRKAYSTRLEFEFSDNEAIYGLGQHEDGILNYRGKQQYLYQSNMKIAIPMIVSTAGYGILWDTYSLASFHDDQDGSYFWTEVDDEMDFYFMYGPEFDQIIAAYRYLTGKSPLFSKWSYGYIQSKERYKTQEELIDVVRKHRQKGIPIDCIVQDWNYWPEGYWGQKSFDSSRYPDPEKMVDEIHKMSVKVMVSIWPIMNNDGPDQLELKEVGGLLPDQMNYNPFSKVGRETYWKQAVEGIFKYGIDAWWCDASEPYAADWKDEVKPDPWKRIGTNTDEFKKYIDPEYINSYTLKHAQTIYEGQREASDKRVVNLTRSHYPGQQRYGTIAWSGDVTATWETFRKQIAEGLNFCLTGAPKWTFDIGAFFVKDKEDLWFWSGNYTDGCKDMGYRELYLRWFQAGTFLPMMRSHGTDTPREVWRFGEQGDKIYDTLINFINLRYRLLPYIYSLAGWETHNNYTMLRCLAFDFRKDENVYNIADQFMFGPAIMVCPVTEPMYYEAGSRVLEGVSKSRQVYLPEGCQWYDFWTGERYEGGQTITAPAPLEKIPLYIKSGSIIPMGPEVQHTGEKSDAAWELRIYPGEDGEFDLYEDEGDGYGYEKEECSWIKVKWNDSSNQLNITRRKGEFPGLVKERTFEIWVAEGDNGKVLNHDDQLLKTIRYTGELINMYR